MKSFIEKKLNAKVQLDNYHKSEVKHIHLQRLTFKLFDRKRKCESKLNHFYIRLDYIFFVFI